MPAAARIAIENATPSFDKAYSYLIPRQLIGVALPGCRVRVPFGRGNQKRTGIILGLDEPQDGEGLKPLLSVLDSQPLLDDEGLWLLRGIKERTFCTWFDALRLLIPSGLGVTGSIVYSIGRIENAAPLSALQENILDFIAKKRAPARESDICDVFSIAPNNRELVTLTSCGAIAKSELLQRKIADDKVCMVRPSGDWEPVPLSPRQKEALAFIEDAGSASLKEICYYTGVSRSVVEALKNKGAVELYDEITWRNPYPEAPIRDSERTELSGNQKAAFEALASYMSEDKPRPALLYGITGSGKTQVFLRLIEKVLEEGKTVIVMVPEISLTAQTVGVFHNRFGGSVAVLHSGLSMGERMDEWRRIKEGGANIVIGTRSAVFAPLKNIGLIVIDEEQEHTYKSEKSPRYHARDVARLRSDYHGALLLLSSATPSVESYYRASRGEYGLVTLDERYGDAKLPEVCVVDMREPVNQSAYPSLSGVLLEELRYNLEKSEQSILLLNRRGYSTVVKCSSCGMPADCPNCSVAMTYHSANDSLICHYCGHTRKKAAECGHCGSSLVRYSGEGTQRLEEDLGELFPNARVLRMDIDTTMAKFSHEKLFSAFLAGEYDIMIGTQMVAKGLNFPNVTLVGVLCADHSLYSGDFRSYERTFSLLTQVVGRGGRGSSPGRAFIQTYSPDNPIIGLAASQDYHAFFKEEIESRRIHLYPPYCTLACFGFTGAALEEVKKCSEEFLSTFKLLAKEHYPDLPLRLLGPAPCDVLRVAGKYRYKLLVKCKQNARTRLLFSELLSRFYNEKSRVAVFADIYYEHM